MGLKSVVWQIDSLRAMASDWIEWFQASVYPGRRNVLQIPPLTLEIQQCMGTLKVFGGDEGSLVRNWIPRLVMCSAVASLGGVAQADQVWINPTGLHVTQQRTVASFDYQIGPSMAGISTQYRWSEWQSMAQHREIGGSESISGRAYEFTLSHYANQGVVFALRDLGTNEVQAVMWGAFSPHQFPQVPHEHAFDSPFNALVLTASATAEGASVEFSDLVFSSALSSAHGAFEDGSVSTPGEATRVQRLIASVNLASIDWTLSGTILGVRDSISGGPGLAGFSIAQTMMTATLIPLPTPLWLGAVGLGLVLSARRRQT